MVRCREQVAETQWTSRYETSRCLPLSAESGGCGRSAPKRCRIFSDSRAPARNPPSPSPNPDKPTRAECARTLRSACCCPSRFTSSSSHSSCARAKLPEPAGFQIHHIHQADKVRAFVIEAVPTVALRALCRSARDTACRHRRSRRARRERNAHLWCARRAEFDRLCRIPMASRDARCRRCAAETPGHCGNASIFAIAERKVPTTSGFAALLNPMWLSLICAKEKSPPRAAAPPPPRSESKAFDFSTPLVIVQITPVPAHAMHFKNPRRSTPSLFQFLSIYFAIARSLRVAASLLAAAVFAARSRRCPTLTKTGGRLLYSRVLEFSTFGNKIAASLSLWNGWVPKRRHTWKEQTISAASSR